MTLLCMFGIQTHSQEPFEKRIDLHELQPGYAVRQSYDGGFIVLSDYYQTLLLKTDANGDTLWTRILPISQDHSNDCALQMTYDSGMVVCGYDQGVALLKTDRDGYTLWKQRYAGETLSVVANGVCTTLDGGYILLASDLYDTWLLKTDGNGNLQWKTRCNYTNAAGRQVRTVCIRQMPDSGYVFCGMVLSPLEVFVERTDKLGAKRWAKGFTQDEVYECGTLCLARDGGVILSGSTYDTRSCLVKLDDSGNVVWDRVYDSVPEGGLGIKCVSMAEGNGYIATGNTHSRLRMVRINEAGDEIWSRTYPDDDNTLTIGYSVRQISGEGFIFSGNLMVYNGGNLKPYLYLLRTDDDGNLHTSGIHGSGRSFPPVIRPNPSDGRFCIDFASESPWKFEIISMKGKVVYQDNDRAFPRTTVSLDLHGQPAGSYILRGKTGQRFLSGKIILN